MSDSLLEDFAKAIERGDSTQVQSLLSSGSIDINARLPRTSNPPLVLAARLAQAGVVDVLLRCDAHIDSTDDDGRSACHASACGYADVLALILAHMDKPSLSLMCKEKGRTPLDYSIVQGNALTSTMLLDAGAPLEVIGDRQLCILASEGTSAIRALIRRNIVVGKFRDSGSRTPLHAAAIIFNNTPDRRAAVNMLINECGVDLEACDDCNSTCTHTAIMHNNHHSTRFFIAAGANLAAKDRLDNTPLHLNCGEKCKILLLAGGADVCVRNNTGSTPCHVVAATSKDDHVALRRVVHLMLACGADLDAANYSGATPRQLMADRRVTFADDDAQAEAVESARREIAKLRLDFVRHRAWQVCIGLQSRGLDALQTCAVLVHACGPVAPLILFHQWWKIATVVKHFKTN